MFKVRLPKDGALTKVAERVSDSTSVSLSSSEGLVVVVCETARPKATLRVSSTPTGASLVGVMLMVTVTVFPSEVPSLDL